MKKQLIILGIVLMMLCSLTSSFAFQWYETFPINTTDQLNLNDTGDTAWTSTAPLTYFQHRIGNTTSPTEFALITSNDIKEEPTRFESEVFDISQASGDITMSFIIGTLDLRDKLSANTKIFVYSKLDGALILERTIVEGDLSKEILTPTFFQLTRDSTGVTYQVIIDFVTEKPEEVFYFDNLFVDYLNASEISSGEITISISNNNTIIINTTILNNLTTIINTTLNPIFIVNTGSGNFSGITDLDVNICPFSTDASPHLATIFKIMLIGGAVLLILSFMIDNAFLAIFAGLFFLYVGIYSNSCNWLFSSVLIGIALFELYMGFFVLDVSATRKNH